MGTRIAGYQSYPVNGLRRWEALKRYLAKPYALRINIRLRAALVSVET